MECPSCGADLPAQVAACPACVAQLPEWFWRSTEPASVSEAPQAAAPDVGFQCQRCGTTIERGARRCSVCKLPLSQSWWARQVPRPHVPPEQIRRRYRASRNLGLGVAALLVAGWYGLHSIGGGASEGPAGSGAIGPVSTQYGVPVTHYNTDSNAFTPAGEFLTFGLCSSGTTLADYVVQNTGWQQFEGSYYFPGRIWEKPGPLGSYVFYWSVPGTGGSKAQLFAFKLSANGQTVSGDNPAANSFVLAADGGC